jgi:hypothetical protein
MERRSSRRRIVSKYSVVFIRGGLLVDVQSMLPVARQRRESLFLTATGSFHRCA